MKRVLLAVAAALSGISLFLLTSASSNTTLFATSYPWLLALNGGMAVVLAALVGMQLHRLLREHREGQFGSRLKMRLVLMFALMGVVPGLVIYGVSLQFVVRSSNPGSTCGSIRRSKAGSRSARTRSITW